VSSRDLPVWQQLKEAVVPVVTWWLLVAFSFVVFAAVLLGTDGLSAENVGALVVIGVPCFAGGALGQVLAFLRVRTWILLIFGAFCWIASAVVAIALPGDLGAIVALGFFILPISLTGGLWSLETHRAVWSTWLPMLLTTGAVIVWAESQGNDANWFAGEKWAIWDAVTLVVLGTAIGLLLLFLVARETHRLALWRRGPSAPLAPTLVERGAARPRLTVLGTVLLVGTALFLTLATAALAPYLWRTGPGDREGETQVEEPQPQPEPQPPQQGCNEQDPSPAPTPPDPQDAEQMGEKMVEAAKNAGAALCMMATLAVLVVALLLVFGPPLRRLLLVRHLRDPFWRLPPTTRIEHGWRLAEIALADAGVTPREGEDARGLARRAAPALRKLSPVEVHGLEEVAEIADRVRFGLGVGPDDVAVMERFAGWVYDTVWERLTQGGQIKAMYRGL
jgi:hypothetical protein